MALRQSRAGNTGLEVTRLTARILAAWFDQCQFEIDYRAQVLAIEPEDFLVAVTVSASDPVTVGDPGDSVERATLVLHLPGGGGATRATVMWPIDSLQPATYRARVFVRVSAVSDPSVGEEVNALVEAEA